MMANPTSCITTFIYVRDLTYYKRLEVIGHSVVKISICFLLLKGASRLLGIQGRPLVFWVFGSIEYYWNKSKTLAGRVCTRGCGKFSCRSKGMVANVQYKVFPLISHLMHISGVWC
jgi:hypothetical protein